MPVAYLAMTPMTVWSTKEDCPPAQRVLLVEHLGSSRRFSISFAGELKRSRQTLWAHGVGRAYSTTSVSAGYRCELSRNLMHRVPAAHRLDFRRNEHGKLRPDGVGGLRVHLEKSSQVGRNARFKPRPEADGRQGEPLIPLVMPSGVARSRRFVKTQSACGGSAISCLILAVGVPQFAHE